MVGNIWNGPKRLEIRQHVTLLTYFKHIRQIFSAPSSLALGVTCRAECQRQIEDADVGEKLYVLSQSGRRSALDEGTGIEQLDTISALIEV